MKSRTAPEHLLPLPFPNSQPLTQPPRVACHVKSNVKRKDSVPCSQAHLLISPTPLSPLKVYLVGLDSRVAFD